MRTSSNQPHGPSAIRDRARRGIEALTGAFGVVGSVALVLLMLHVVANTAMRYFFASPIGGTTEYVAFWYMPAVIFFGFARAQQIGEHIEARLLYDRFPPGVKLEFTLFGNAITLGLLLLFAWFGLESAIRDFGIGLTAGASTVTIWPTGFFVPIGFLLLALQILLDTVEIVRTRRPLDEDTKAVDEISEVGQ